MSLSLCGVFTSLAYDCQLDHFTLDYCLRRINNEGYVFLCKTLPKISKTVLRSLELGFFDRSDLTDFAWKGGLLRYFRGYLLRIFSKRGKLLQSVDPVALSQLRQLCEYFYKLAVPFSEARLEEAERSFIEDDAQLAKSAIDFPFVDQLRKDFETHYPQIAHATVDKILKDGNVRSGKGTFSGCFQYTSGTGLKWYQRKYQYHTCDPKYKAYEGLFRPYPSAPPSLIGDQSIDYSEVLFVPKDSRGPRTIVREPYETLRSQLAFNSWLSRHLETLSQGRVNFQDQSVNRDLAKAASVDRSLATLDLSSASDMVHSLIIEKIVEFCPGMRFFVKNRTRIARTPSGKFIPLNKLAGMGSGLTFPLMSLLITLAITRSIVDKHGISYTRARKCIYVYGDDIIVPVEYFDCACEALSKVLLRLNISKTYVTSHFRESCGGDYYNGVSVSPVRLKLSSSGLFFKESKALLHFKERNSFVLELERHCRELVKNSLDELADYYYSILEKMVGRLPFISGQSAALGRYQNDPWPYFPDCTGTYPTFRVLVPAAGLLKGHSADFHYLMQQFFLRTGKVDAFGNEIRPVGLTSEGIPIPRKIILKRTNVNVMTLIL